MPRSSGIGPHAAAAFAALPLSWLLLPTQALLLTEIAIVALVAISLDLILGYAGIVSLGHAAFFGFGAYTAALFAKNVLPDPIVGLAVAIAARKGSRRSSSSRAAGSSTSGWRWRAPDDAVARFDRS